MGSEGRETDRSPKGSEGRETTDHQREVRLERQTDEQKEETLQSLRERIATDPMSCSSFIYNKLFI